MRLYREFIAVIKTKSPRKIKDFIIKNERQLSPLAMLFGFIVDSITLTRVDLPLDNLILLGYLFLIAISIFIINSDGSGLLRYKPLGTIVVWLPLVMQFAFGGLFSGFVVLYARSASIISSWPFLVILLILLIGNEFFRDRYHRLIFQLNIFFVAIFSYLIFAVPVLLNRIGPFIFILSGILSLFVIYLIIKAIASIAPWKIGAERNSIFLSILAIYAFFNFLYFANIIPPIPLALKDIVVAHNVQRLSANDVTVTFEPAPWYKFYRDFDSDFNRVGNERVYVYSAIFAPADLRTTIVHEWSHFNESQDKWIVRDKIQYQIFGGRDEGYRGFSFKTGLEEGKWRVAVKTKGGQSLGRTKFNIIQVSEIPELVMEVR